MKKSYILIAVVGLVALLLLILGLRNNNRGLKSAHDTEGPPPATKSVSNTLEEEANDQPEISPYITNFTNYYAAPQLPPENDLIILTDLFSLFQQRLRGTKGLPTSGNAEIVRALQGDNDYQEVFLPNKHPFISDKGLLLDRWAQPLYFHFINSQKPEIRSAGPDQKFWSDDDLVLTP